jgi:hypothetical protein
MNYSNSYENDVHTFDEIPAAEFEPGKAHIKNIVDAPKFSIPKLSKVRNKIYHALLDKEEDFDEVVTPDTCTRISKIVCQEINYPLKKCATVHDTIKSVFFNKDISPKRLYQIATKISGNIEIIREDTVVPSWEETDVPIWVPVEIVSIEEVYGASPGKKIKAFITAGIPAGMSLIQIVSNKFIQYMLREIGYPKYQKFDAQEIFNTRFTCNIAKIKGRTKMVAFSVSHSQEKHNKTLFKIRHDACPWKKPIECTQCLNGLDKCPGGLHPDTYIVGDCAQGHRGIMKVGNKKCNNCLEHAKMEAAKKLFEKRRKEYG